MRFLADESCDFAVVRALRVAGHDVAAVAEISARATDGVVLELAIRESRILLTETRTSVNCSMPTRQRRAACS